MVISSKATLTKPWPAETGDIHDRYKSRGNGDSPGSRQSRADMEWGELAPTFWAGILVPACSAPAGAGARKAAASCRTPQSSRIVIVMLSYNWGALTWPWDL